jgi:hypothetical protein
VLTLFERAAVVMSLGTNKGLLLGRLNAFLLASCFSAGLDLHKNNLTYC